VQTLASIFSVLGTYLRLVVEFQFAEIKNVERLIVGFRFAENQNVDLACCRHVELKYSPKRVRIVLAPLDIVNRLGKCRAFILFNCHRPWPM
jgi:hypothetical protein